MPTYTVKWSMYGTATVNAPTADEAQEAVTDGCMDWGGDIDWDDVHVDGSTVAPAEEA